MKNKKGQKKKSIFIAKSQMKDCYLLQMSTFGMQKSIQKKPLTLLLEGKKDLKIDLNIATRGVYYSEALMKGDFPFTILPFIKGKMK